MKISDKRLELTRRVLPEGVPDLWCPLISHYAADGSFDRARMRTHFSRLAPYVKGFLMPGSTGDGWEMDDDEIRALLEITLEAARDFDFRILIGVLKTETDAAQRVISDTVAWLQQRVGENDPVAALVSSRVCGFTVCPPKGADRSQSEIRAALASVLNLGLPTSLYQLPQMTANEMSPAIVSSLAAEFPNFILFKDTSGGDEVASSDSDLGGVFKVRGAEGDYARWPLSNGGVYDGFLLSTANVFPGELAQILELLKAGRIDEAEDLSNRLDAIVQAVFPEVAGLEFGNAFANANKAMDDVMAFGGAAGRESGPRTHSGRHLPVDLIARVAVLMRDAGFCPDRGYLAGTR